MLFAAVLFALALSVSAKAQDGPDVRYRDIKDIYDYSTYSEGPGDWYSPSIAGFISLALPGNGLQPTAGLGLRVTF